MSYNEQAAKYKELKAQADALKVEMAIIAEELRDIYDQTGEQPEVEGVTLQHRAGYVSQTWDRKGLTGYAVAHPEILTFLTEKQIAATIAIIVK